MKKIVHVAAAVITRPDGSFLVGQRAADTFYPGYWEFPGGKVEAEEDPRAALQRELREELGIETTVGEIVDVTFHRYAEKTVLLLFFEATRTATSPAPTAIEVAAVQWAEARDLADERFPEADVPVLRKVRARCR